MVVPQLMGAFFRLLWRNVNAGKRQKVLQNYSPNKPSFGERKYSYLRLLHSGRFMDELFKPCERLEHPVISRNPIAIETARLFTSEDSRSCFALAFVKARGRTTRLTVAEFNISVIVVTRIVTF